MTTAVYLTDRESPSFQAGRSSVDVVCAGDSITGWNNIGEVEGWPFPTYPESLQRLCEPSGLTVANCGIAGEVSPNGIGQVRDYLELFPNARYFVLGYGANDLDKWPEVEATSPRIVENLDRMVEAIGHGGRTALLLGLLHVNGAKSPREEFEPLRRMLADHNDRLGRHCRERHIPLVEVWGKLRDEHFADPYHPNDEGARIIAEEVFRVLSGVREAP
jgi:lysophospholipase L1-like esterase